jgi:hypothetical protein
LCPRVEPLEDRAVPATITVMTAADAGPGSLRAAIMQADADNDGDTIDFAPSVKGAITLQSALPDLSAAMTITGPGSSALAVDRSAAPGTPLFGIFTVDAGANVAISGLTITGGNTFTNGAGGGISNAGTLTVTGSTISRNRATGDPFASSDGGGIVNEFGGTLMVVGCTISGNLVSGYTGGGGGIFNGGTLAVTDCTISGNSAVLGGGIANFSGTVTVTDSTLSGNTAHGVGDFVGDGGGIDNLFSGTLTVADSTLSGNSADSGGGIANIFNGFMGNSLTVVASIFADGPGGTLINSGGMVTSQGHNLFSDAPAVPLDPTDLTDTDPLLGPLADNGGPTFTQALLPGSPAIDAGAAVPGVTTDQRGVPRPQGAAPDIGAFESRGFTLVVAQGSGQIATVGAPSPRRWSSPSPAPSASRSPGGGSPSSPRRRAPRPPSSAPRPPSTPTARLPSRRRPTGSRALTASGHGPPGPARSSSG